MRANETMFRTSLHVVTLVFVFQVAALFNKRRLRDNNRHTQRSHSYRFVALLEREHNSRRPILTEPDELT